MKYFYFGMLWNLIVSCLVTNLPNHVFIHHIRLLPFPPILCPTLLRLITKSIIDLKNTIRNNIRLSYLRPYLLIFQARAYQLKCYQRRYLTTTTDYLDTSFHLWTLRLNIRVYVTRFFYQTFRRRMKLVIRY